jgi:hypothetical protein
MTYSYWYAIISAPQANSAGETEFPRAWGCGLHDSALRLVVYDGLAAVLSDWPQASVRRSADLVDPDLVWQHEHVIERIMAQRPVLPVRFGTVLAGDERVREVLAKRAPTMRADLDHVSGCVELGLRVLWDPPAMPPVSESAGAAGAAGAAVQETGAWEPQALQAPGTRYLLRRAAAVQARRNVQQRAQQLAGELSQALCLKAVDTRQTVLQTERMLLNAAFLVRQAETSEFFAAVEGLRASHRQLAFLCSGPWPPYHFVSV